MLSESEVRSEIRSGLPRTYVPTNVRTKRVCHLSGEILPFVTRTRAYGLADVDEIQPHPKFAPPKADETRAAPRDRLRRNMEASA